MPVNGHTSAPLDVFHEHNRRGAETMGSPPPSIERSKSKSQFASYEDLQIVLNPFSAAKGGAYITGDVATLVIKKPDGSLISPSVAPVFDESIEMWVATVPVASFQRGEWLIYATSDNSDALPQFLVLWWGDYVDDIFEARQAAVGRWKIANNRLQLFEDDGVTVFKEFDLLDENGNPTSTKVFVKDPIP